MSKFFQHKHLVRLMAFAVLFLAVSSISLPKISKYNAEVREEQIRLKIAANGTDDRKTSFGIYTLERGNEENILIVILSSLFLSLVLTKRIKFSLLFALLLFIEIVTFLVLEIDSHFADSYYFEFLFLAFWFISSLGLAIPLYNLTEKGFRAKSFLN